MEAFELLLQDKNSKVLSREVLTEYRSLKKSLQELEDIEKSKQSKGFLKYFITYSKVMDRVAADVNAAKKRYENIDKQKLIDNRLVELATNIKICRKRAHLYNSQISQTELKIKQIASINQGISYQNESLKTLMNRKQSSKSRTKSFYLQQNSHKEQQNRKVWMESSKFIELPQKLIQKESRTLGLLSNDGYDRRQSSVSSKRSCLQYKRINKLWECSAQLHEEIKQ